MRGLHATVRAYYSGKIERHGPTPLGVDWPNAISQYLRFAQLLTLCDFAKPFSVNDFGCGYGALLEYLAIRHDGAAVTYRGVDISPAMIEAARDRWSTHPQATFAIGSRCGRTADYSLSSGVFNVRLGHPVREWETYVELVLADLRDNSRLGFAVNFMLPHDTQPTEHELYRTEPQRWLAACEKLGAKVELLGGYGLREFTLLVRLTPRKAPRTGAGLQKLSPRSRR